MKRFVTLQYLLLAGWATVTLAQTVNTTVDAPTPRQQPATRPEPATPSVTPAPVAPAPTNAVEIHTISEAPLFEGRALDLYGITEDWKPSAERPTVTGPLVYPMRGRVSEAPRRLLDVVNPFAPLQAPPATLQKSPVKGLTSRSWASTVGWRPGRSEFADVTTHEPSSGLLIIKCPK